MALAAILGASRMTGDPPVMLRASLHFAGQTLVEYQARQAARAGADRIMIVVSVITPAISQAVDRLSADGIVVALIRDMISLVRDAPRDMDILLVADGVIVTQDHFDALAGVEGNALLVTDDSRAAAPFERIDAGQRWAGVARITPALLFGTLDMIGDWDLSLTLVRGAVQKEARRITVPQDDLLEGRVALVDGQPHADLVARAVTTAGSRSAAKGGVENYLLAPLARRIGPQLMRTQIPAVQVRIAAIGLAAIALVPIELGWAVTGLLFLLVALLLAETSDILDELSLRHMQSSAIAFLTPGLALGGAALAGGTMTSVHLALAAGIVMVADRWRRTGAVAPWMLFTPANVLIVLIIAGLFGRLAQGVEFSLLCAVASLAAIILRRRDR